MATMSSILRGLAARRAKRRGLAQNAARSADQKLDKEIIKVERAINAAEAKKTSELYVRNRPAYEALEKKQADLDEKWGTLINQRRRIWEARDAARRAQS